MAKKNSSSNVALFKRLGLRENNPGVFNGTWSGSGKVLRSVSPVDGKLLATVRLATAAEYEQTIRAAEKAFVTWRTLPAPRRGVTLCDNLAMPCAQPKKI
ncbi:MAG: aldehyde dehydrogenase family protein [Limisphaerales bacterium]